MDLARLTPWITGDDCPDKAKDVSFLSPVAELAAVILICGDRWFNHLCIGLDYGQVHLDSVRHLAICPIAFASRVARHGPHNFSHSEPGHSVVEGDETSERLARLVCGTVTPLIGPICKVKV